MKQLPLAINMGPQVEATFDNFQTGDNAAVVQHMRTLADASAPIFLWGPPGSGKSHLLKALAKQYQDRGERVAWFGAIDLPPWNDESEPSLIVFDDCDRFVPAQQHEAFTLFIEATQRRAQIAACARVPPVDLKLRDDLRTRLGWGVVFGVLPLSEANARAALRREADRRGVLLSDEVMHHLLTRFERDLKSLVALLDRLDLYALAEKRAITVPLIRQMMAEEANAKLGAHPPSNKPAPAKKTNRGDEPDPL